MTVFSAYDDRDDQGPVSVDVKPVSKRVIVILYHVSYAVIFSSPNYVRIVMYIPTKLPWKKLPCFIKQDRQRSAGKEAQRYRLSTPDSLDI